MFIVILFFSLCTSHGCALHAVSSELHYHKTNLFYFLFQVCVNSMHTKNQLLVDRRTLDGKFSHLIFKVCALSTFTFLCSTCICANLSCTSFWLDIFHFIEKLTI